MPRKGPVPKRDVLPDPIYNSKVVTRLINQIMVDGKRGLAQRILYDAFNISKKKVAKTQWMCLSKQWKTLCQCLKCALVELVVPTIKYQWRCDQSVVKP